MDSRLAGTMEEGCDLGAKGQAAGSAPSVSLILPAYNEQETIEQAIREADEALASLTPDYEILVVDDGSTDRTAEIAREQAGRRRSVRILRQPQNRGYGAALRRGFEAAEKDLVAFTDADCQFDARELDRLVPLAAHYEIACGYRIERRDSVGRLFWSKGYNFLVNLFLGIGVRDCNCALKVFRREVVKAIRPDAAGFFFNAELLSEARLRGVSIVEVGVTHRARRGGRSTVSARQAIPVGASLLRHWWRRVFFPAPARAGGAGGDAWSDRVEWGARLLLCAAALLLFFSKLSYPLIEPDETRYAQISMEMAESGDWVTPTLDGQPYLDKPPLLFWLTGASYRVFGVNEAAARFPGALAGFLTVLLTYGLGKRLIGSRAAWWGAVSLLLCGGFVFSARFLHMDNLLTLFTTTALLSGYLACCGARFRIGWWLAAGLACGLGVLAKGPIAAVLCFPPLVAWRWLAGGAAPLRLRHWLALLAVALLAAAPWFTAIAAARPEFIGYFFWKHHVLRFVTAFDHEQGLWFYLPVIFAGMFPASVLLPPLAVFLASRSAAARRARFRELGFLLLAAVWVVGFFSLSRCKLPSYILPALPPLCLLIGAMMEAEAFAPRGRTLAAEILRPMPKRTAILVLAFGAAAAGADLLLAPESGPGPWLDAAFLLGALLASAVVWRARFGGAEVAWGCTAGLAVLCLTFGFSKLFPDVSARRSVHVAAASLHARLGDEHSPIIYFDHDVHSARLYLPSEELVALEEDQIEDLRRLAREHGETVIVTTPRAADKVQEALGSLAHLASRGRGGRIFLTSSGGAPTPRLSAEGRPAVR